MNGFAPASMPVATSGTLEVVSAVIVSDGNDRALAILVHNNTPQPVRIGDVRGSLSGDADELTTVLGSVRFVIELLPPGAYAFGEAELIATVDDVSNLHFDVIKSALAPANYEDVMVPVLWVKAGDETFTGMIGNPYHLPALLHGVYVYCLDVAGQVLGAREWTGSGKPIGSGDSIPFETGSTGDSLNGSCPYYLAVADATV